MKKPGTTRGCENCEYKSGDFSNDTVDPEITRVYCKARHVNVDAEKMSKDCDFWSMDPAYVKPTVEDKSTGI